MTLSFKTQQLIKKAKANHAARLAAEAQKAASIGSSSSSSAGIVRTSTPQPGHVHASEVKQVFTEAGVFRPTIPGVQLNEKQLQAVELACRGKSFNLIGAAGTGKTTTTREVIAQLVKLPHCKPIAKATANLHADSPGVVIVSFTNKAVNNIKKHLPKDLQQHCLTIHKLLEFKPVNSFDKMELEERFGLGGPQGNFLPTYHKDYKLPHISVVIVEESSMVGYDDHWQWILAALPDPAQTQFIFLGDINQLPPIFGPSVLGFKMIELETVELTHVYRQALESPIITLAHKIREGRSGPRLVGSKKESEHMGFSDDRGAHGKVTIHPWKVKMEPGPACRVAQDFIKRLHAGKQYDPESDVILCPYNKAFGTLELNKGIADYLGKLRNAMVYEVIARGQRSYFAVGDRVLVDRQEAVIKKIDDAPGYNGRMPDDPSQTMDRWGRDPKRKLQLAVEVEDKSLMMARGMDVLDSLELSMSSGEGEKNDASHQIQVEFCDTGVTKTLTGAGDINGMLFAYCLTVHKSQGSEWRRVFIFLHYSHNNMLSRELMYTAVTRAREELFIICEPDRRVSGTDIYNSITRAAKNPEIVGVTLAEKAEYFRAKKKVMQRQESAAKKQEELEEMEE